MPEALAEDDILLLSGKIDFYWIIAACRVRVAALLGGGYHCSLPLSRASRQVLVAPHGGSPIANAFFRKRIFYEGIDSDIEFRLFKEQLFGGEESFYEAVTSKPKHFTTAPTPTPTQQSATRPMPMTQLLATQPVPMTQPLTRPASNRRVVVPDGGGVPREAQPPSQAGEHAGADPQVQRQKQDFPRAVAK
jgi:hypothetical protein